MFLIIFMRTESKTPPLFGRNKSTLSIWTWEITPPINIQGYYPGEGINYMRVGYEALRCTR